MKDIYPTNKKNTHRGFSDNFHNIKNFVQVGRIEFFLFFVTKKRIIFPLFVALEKPFVVGKIFQMAKINAHLCQIIV